MGKRSNPCDYIRASDLYVSASEKEGLPFNILEALGCGKITLASDIKGHRDIIENGKSGVLYPKGDINEFVRCVKAIHKDEIKINPEDASARYKTYSFDNVFEKTYGTMKELLEK
jgi:glycosyltransferase EpsD